MQSALLIEDEDFIRDSYKRELVLEGFRADTAANGKEGITLLSHNQYDLILLDIMLPDMNGFEILKMVKEDPRHEKSVVVLLSNLGQDEVVKEGFKLGAEGYFIKASLTPPQVVSELKNILQSKTQKPTSVS